jgi:hypothetical protein
MESIPWILITIVLILIISFAFFVVNSKKKGRKETDYRIFFIIGATFIPIGIATDNQAFFILGLVFIAISLINKDRWEKK